MVAKNERDIHVEKAKEAALQKHLEHAALLHRLETEFGFDLDVATDIYGISFMEPLDTHVDLATKWLELLSAMKEDPGKPLVILAKIKMAKPIFVGGMQQNQNHIVVAAARSCELSNLKYEKTTEENTSRISIDSDLVLVSDKAGVAPLKEFDGPLVLAEPFNFERAIFYARNYNTVPQLRPDFTDLTVLYNPKAEDIYTVYFQDVSFGYQQLQMLVDRFQIEFSPSATSD